MSDKNEICQGETQACESTALATRRVVQVKPRYTSRYDEEAWEVKVELPGVSKNDVSVTVENEILDIRAVRRFEVPEGWKSVGQTHDERDYRLRLDVGPEVDETKISAEVDSGVLVLRLPLRDEVKPRTIEVR